MRGLERLVEGLDRHALKLALLALLITAGLAYPARMFPPSEVASTSPNSPMFEAQAALRAEMSGPVHVLTFVLEDPEGDMWRPEALRALGELSAQLRASPLQDRLWSYDSYLYRREFLGLLSPTDLIEQEAQRPLSSLSDEQLATAAQQVAERVLSSPSQLIIPSGKSAKSPEGRWRSPALILNVLADLKRIGAEPGSLKLNRADPPEERYGRALLAQLRAHAGPLKVSGVALDVNLSTQEQGERSGPFIGATLLVTLLLLALSLRSYWAVTLMGLGLATLMIWLKGASNLIGLKSDPILSLIVPIAMISFGVDAGVHSLTRYREERHGEGFAPMGPRPAIRLALVGTLGALCLAAFTDLTAFLVNLLSELESVRQFGVASAIALGCSFVLLGVLCPLLLARIEARLPSRSAPTWLKLPSLIATSLAATAVVMSVVFIDLDLGLSLYVAYGLIALGLPLIFLRGEERAPERLKGAPSRQEPLSERQLKRLSAWIHRSPQLIVLSAALLLGAALPLAATVRVEFDIRHLLDPSSELVRGLDHLDEHLTGRGGEPSAIYIEGPLAEPHALQALKESLQALRELKSPYLAQDVGGATRVDGGLIDLWSAQGAPLTRAELERWLGRGVFEEGAQARGLPPRWAVDEVATMFAIKSAPRAPRLWLSTRFELQLAQTQSSDGIKAAQAQLSPHIEALRRRLQALDPQSEVTLTGGAVARQAELDAISDSMLSSLPVALGVCLIIVGLALRSLYQSLCCVATLGVVIAALFAAMSALDYGLNFMSATLGALSIGVGVDYATHITARITEERSGPRLSQESLERALKGTGLALLISAGSSILGFAVLACAPMPLFAAYGTFTALMISLALLSSVTLLPALLMLPERLRRDDLADVS